MMTYEQSLARVREIVRSLETGDEPIERQLELWEEGKRIVRVCQGYLHDADAKIKAAVGGGE